MVQMGRKSTGSNPSVFPDSQVIPECLVLQYSQIHRSYQNAWSFSISRFRGHTRMLAQMVWEPKHSKLMVQMDRKSTGSNPAVFPDSQVIPECLVLQYFQIHRSYQNAWSFSISRFTGPQNAWSSDAQSISSDTQHKRYKFRHPKYKFRHPKYKFRHPKQAV